MSARWIPIGIVWRNGEPVVDWCRLEGGFSEPLFHQTVSRALKHPFNQLLRRVTQMSALQDVANECDAAIPSGMIFHMSRCGSTLASRMLGARRDMFALSEPGPLDAVLRSPLRDPLISDEQRISWLRSVVTVLGRPPDVTKRKFVLKMDAWHTAHISLFERAFPGVPWVFIYRHPVEVMVSHMREQSYMMSAVNAPSLIGQSLTQAVTIPRAEYVARVLAAVCEPVLARVPRADQLVNYSELPGAVSERIAPTFGLDIDEDDRLRMFAPVDRHAKRPEQAFQSDSIQKQRQSDESLRALAQEWLAPTYEGLERLRLSG